MEIYLSDIELATFVKNGQEINKYYKQLHKQNTDYMTENITVTLLYAKGPIRVKLC